MSGLAADEISFEKAPQMLEVLMQDSSKFAIAAMTVMALCFFYLI